MSGLENFERTDDWLSRLKNFLIEKRLPSPKMNIPTSPTPIFDFDEEFQKTLQEKCPLYAIKSTASNDNKENYTPKSANIKYLNDSVMPMSPTSQNCLEVTANDSFFYLEKICNKTISDPNSTIHSYIENMRKESTSSINMSNNINVDDENAAIERLLNECDLKEHYLPERTIFHVGDQTQLGDIEAPSGLWDSTITTDQSLLHMSPTKRVGLLRPSTIMEEPNSSYSESENSRNTSSMFSFKTAAPKSNETTNYETANDTIHTIEQRKINSLDSDVFSSKNTLDDVSSIIDDSLNNFSKNKTIAKDSLDMTLNDTKNNNLSKENTSFIEISDEEENYSQEESILNEGFSLQSIDDKDNSDSMNETLSDSNGNGLNVSRVFNDTFEEVDYILQQGIKMMNNTSVQPMIIKTTTGNSATLNVYTPSPTKTPSTPKTPNTIISKQQYCIKKHAPSTNEKKELFKKPTLPAGTRIPQPKSLTYLKKPNPYSNVISPVGAYIKNSPKTPIVGNIRETTIRSLDYGQQMGKQQIIKNNFKQQVGKSNSKEFTSSLPKKAYQSAEYREVRDERTPLNIPGGYKIHKYLQSALKPGIARHDGKMKFIKSNMDSLSDGASGAAANTTVDSSLADLSVMSGDVSLYTLIDAQTFGKSVAHK